MNRRTFLSRTAVATASVHINPVNMMARAPAESSVRLGGPLFDPYGDPEGWIALLRKAGYRAAYCPVGPEAGGELIDAYREAAARNDIMIAEVGAWSNPLSPDPEEAAAALETCINGLQLAERIGAACCVNISGSRNPDHWAGPHRDNLTPEIFDLVVENTRKVIDAVRPTRTCFALEAMPWSLPDSTETYLQLLKAVERSRFGVHLDPVNMIRSPREYFANGELIREMFRRLGPHIRSCHAKDITLREDNYIPQLDEVRPGLGNLDYGVFLGELARLEDVPLMMEHLDSAEAYTLAAGYIRSVGRSSQIGL